MNPSEGEWEKKNSGVWIQTKKVPDPTVKCDCGLHWNSKLFNFCTACGEELGGVGGGS
jgi:hypothetical protein